MLYLIIIALRKIKRLNFKDSAYDNVELRFDSLMKGGIKMKFKNKISSQWQLQAMIWPSIILMIIFSFIPMFGLIIAFQDYSPLTGFTGSEFVGLEN